MLTFRPRYLFFAGALFLIEVLIARFVHDRWVRPYVGDFLVVVLIYCAVRAFFKVSVRSAAVFTLLFAYAVEGLQYLQVVDRLGLRSSKLATVVIGTAAEWADVVAYTLGVALVWWLEKSKWAQNRA